MVEQDDCHLNASSSIVPLKFVFLNLQKFTSTSKGTSNIVVVESTVKSYVVVVSFTTSVVSLN